MRIFVDMSSLMWTCLLAGKDPEANEVEHEGRKVSVPSLAWGYENAINSLVAVLRESNCVPRDLVLVFEGKDSKRRRCMIEPTYKATRDSRPPEAYLVFNALKEKLGQVLRNLGATAVTQDGVEGDDVLAYLAAHTEEDAVVMSNDNDLIWMNGTNEYGGTTTVRINSVSGVNKYGDFDFKLVTLYKALVGDSSDNIKGVKGFGPKAWMAVNIRYGDDGCAELERLVVTGNRDEVAVIAKENGCKFLDKVVDQWDAAVQSYRLAQLHPEWVNTIRMPLVWTPGITLRTDDERLEAWAAKRWLVTAKTYAAKLAFLKAHVNDCPWLAFDIETSTSAESTEWLAEQGDAFGVDALDSKLTGFSITFGNNGQYTYYVSVDHADTENVTMVQAREMIEVMFGKQIEVQNTYFELPVLYLAQDEDGSLWRDHWRHQGEFGFLPGVRDTKLEGSYVDENQRLGLKERSSSFLGYTQATYEESTQITGPQGTLPTGGMRRKLEEVEGEMVETRQYKMRELSARHVFTYASDDTICTAALHNFYRLHMQLEHHWKVYLQVELNAAYLHALSFVKGMAFDLPRMKELEKQDAQTHETAWTVVRDYLIAHNWDGTVPPTYTAEITAKELKEAYAIVQCLVDDSDDEDADEDTPAEAAPAPKHPVLSSRIRTPSKLVAFIAAQGDEEFAALAEGCLAGRAEAFTKYVRQRFTGEPRFAFSNKQMQRLLYETMALPVRVRGKATKIMLSKGIKQGNPKGDALAVAYALRDGTDAQRAVLENLKLMQMARIRQSLYYSKYPYFMHHTDGMLHSSHNQCATNTRRASSMKPNMQQQPLHTKIAGQPAKFRSTIKPHKPGAVVVSMDFAAQELRIIAEYSQDTNMLACFVGEQLKDMHILTAAGIMAEERVDGWDYDRFAAEYSAEDTENFPMLKNYRALGKKVNFTSEYGAMAPKLAATLLIDETLAQKYLDAREDAFPQTKQWKLDVIADAKRDGVVRTMLGAVRHLAPAFASTDRYVSSKAERQAVNFMVQSSSAEQTKLAECRMWRQGLFVEYDAVCYGPIHDEVVASVMIEDLHEFLPKMHACMVAPYAGMSVPIRSSISIGPNFYNQKELGEEYDYETTQAAIDKLKETT